MRYDLIDIDLEIITKYDAPNLKMLTEQIDDEYNGDVLHYIDDLIEEYIMNINNIADLRQYLVYLDSKMRYFTIGCRHYALERLFDNLDLKTL